MSEPLVSVVLPIYKVEAFLKECVNSVINQTYKNLEIFLVDDGSPDSCPELCDSYAETDSRIKVIHKINGGLSDARNAAIDVCTGEYITFVDSDDVIHPSMIEALMKPVIEQQVEISAGSYSNFTDNYIINDLIEASQIMTFEQLTEKPLYITAWGKIYKTCLFENIRYPKGKLHEDEFTTWKLLDKAEKIAYTPAPLYFYRQREGSIIAQKKLSNFIDTVDALKERISYFQKKENTFQYRFSFYQLLNLFLDMSYGDFNIKFEKDFMDSIKAYLNDFDQKFFSTKECKNIKSAVKNPVIYKTLLRVKNKLKKL